MATVPYRAYLPAGLTAYSDPLNRRDWGKTTAGVVTVGGLWSGYSKITNPAWPNNGKVYWVKGTLAEYVPDVPPPPPVAGAPDPIPAGEFPIVLDGITYVNTNPIEWIRKPE